MKKWYFQETELGLTDIKVGQVHEILRIKYTVVFVGNMGKTATLVSEDGLLQRSLSVGYTTKIHEFISSYLNGSVNETTRASVGDIVVSACGLVVKTRKPGARREIVVGDDLTINSNVHKVVYIGKDGALITDFEDQTYNWAPSDSVSLQYSSSLYFGVM
ncbi:MAG: hypothetical protein ACRDCE_21350 [Cetobacterium sp.]|uniref:hypothetical protein n=1 Tax=Cetobacterium sp. TaxID=2071632 RepID=UPI003EE5D0DB